MKLFAFILFALYSIISFTENINEIIPVSEISNETNKSDKIRKSIIVTTEKEDSIQVDLFIQPEHKRHIERLEKITSLALKFLGANIGRYPKNKLTIVDIPKNMKISKTTSSAEIFFDVDFFLAKQSFEFEMSVASKIASLYFSKAVNEASSDKDWLIYGLSRYVAHKIVEEFYPVQMNTFHLVGYFPIYGITFLSYNEIPIIYTLRYFNVPLESSSLKKYYRNSNSVPVTGRNADALNSDELEVKNVHKPYLLMLALDRYLGEKKVINILSKYYQKNLFAGNEKKEFSDILLEAVQNDEDFNSSLFSSLKNNYKYDYAIDSLTAIGENEYRIIASRKEAGVFPVEIFAYSENDTLKFSWDGKSVHKKITFKSREKIIAAELDPKHKNIFDFNYANNSYMLEPDYTTSVSVAIRWFFWIQNAIIIIGSVG